MAQAIPRSDPSAGADPRAQDENGVSPYDLALRSGRDDIVAMLTPPEAPAK